MTTETTQFEPLVQLPARPPTTVACGVPALDDAGTAAWWRELCDRGPIHAALLEAIADNASLLSLHDLRLVHEMVLSLVSALQGRAIDELETADVDWQAVDGFDALVEQIDQAAEGIQDQV